MEEKEIYETIKEYSYSHGDLDFRIHARISKRIKPTGRYDYEWDISHYCMPFEGAASVYIPGLQIGNSFEETEILLFKYLTKFTAIKVVKNDFY